MSLQEERGGPEEHERELSQLFPEIWTEDKDLDGDDLTPHPAPQAG